MIDVLHPINVCRASAGTGKTYTLAAYYVGLLLSGEDYRSILAITFTNKATAEMSERIMGYLYAISDGGEEAFFSYAKRFMIAGKHHTDAELRQRAGECFRQMLLDYDNVKIQTIDSFLQTLLSGLSGVLQMSAGLSTELDIDHVIRQAVDQLLTTELTAADRTILEDYMRIKLDRESYWDVRKSLCSMVAELYNESVQVLDANGRILFDAKAIARRRENVEKAWQTDPDLVALRKQLEQCAPDSYNRYTKAAYDRLVRSVDDPQKVSAADRFRGVEDKYCNAPEMAFASQLAARIARRYNTLQLTVRFSRDMELMASLQALIQRNLAEANCALLARTASTLSNALREGDADFILEKAGIRYRHVLIDEFQDTSRLQWSVIRQLLMDVLAGQGHTLLVVGDIKQSIYRWRNGDWHIMSEMAREDGPFGERINKEFPNLTRNFRSSEQVVNFNLSLFKHIVDTYPFEQEKDLIRSIYNEDFAPELLDRFYQSDKKQGGYVRFRAFPNGTKEEMTLYMFDAMEALMAKGALASDMMILVREKKDAALITDLKSQITSDKYPNLVSAGIVSADSFLLEASEAVCMVIAGLRVLAQEDEVAAKYIEIHTDVPDVIHKIRSRINEKTPLYEAVCELVKILLTDVEGRYIGTETAYINNLLDRVRAYVGAYGSSVADFLIYWDDTMHAKPIPPSAMDAIRILTVHASKGLQAQTLFVPFCTWTKEAGRHPQKIWCRVAEEVESADDYVPVQDGVEMENSAYWDAYDAEHLDMRIDNLNMLYVALTRAEDNLYISTSYPVNKSGKMGTCNHVGRYIMDYLQADEYEAGEPVIIDRQSFDSSNKSSNPFSFAGVPAENAELWADSDGVRFVQSQEGALYTDYGDEAYRRVARMELGTLCHEIFAHLRKADELEKVLDEFESRGEIRGGQKEELASLISSAWIGSPEMQDWFTAPWQLKLEEAIYIDHRELRPDRVMINPQTNEAIVLDYKFGQWEDKYLQQVREYMEALRRIGYAPVRGFLWFAHKPVGHQLVEVHG